MCRQISALPDQQPKQSNLAMTREKKATTTVPGLPAMPGSAMTSDQGRSPLWVPQGVDLEVVPEEVRQALAEVVQPVYERMVLQTDDPLERSLGVTIAHLLWLEVLQQFDLKREYVQVSAVLGLSGNRGPMIEQHLRIIYSKVKVGGFLARLRELRRKWEEKGGENAIR
jgi:hypothetical protein